MSKHTPGPWNLRLPGFSEADRKLANTAPELLEALEAIIVADDAGELDQELIDAGRAAIRKATA